MPTPTTSVRAVVKARLVELLVGSAGAVQVSYGWPQDRKDELIYVGATRGTVTVADLRAGRKTRDDTFTVEMHVLAGKPGQRTAQAAEERALELCALIEDVLAANPTLGDLDGVLWAAQRDTRSDTEDPVPTPEGYLGVAQIDIEVKTRLS